MLGFNKGAVSLNATHFHSLSKDDGSSTIPEWYWDEREYKHLEEMFIKLLIHEQWSKCRLRNSRAKATTPLCALLTMSSTVPPIFPANIEILDTMSLEDITELLLAYGQHIPPTLDARRRAFSRFIGVPVVHVHPWSTNYWRFQGFTPAGFVGDVFTSESEWKWPVVENSNPRLPRS